MKTSLTLIHLNELFLFYKQALLLHKLVLDIKGIPCATFSAGLQIL